MKPLAPLLMILAAGALAACNGPGGSANPPQLFLATNGDELHLRLVPIEPHPY